MLCFAPGSPLRVVTIEFCQTWMLVPEMPEISEIARRMKKEYDSVKSWQKVADAWGVTKPMAYRIALKGYEPKKIIIRHHLGLPALAPAPVCPIHGVVHVSRRCPQPGKPRLPWMSAEEVEERLKFIRSLI